jgi:hypothetical protein
MKTTPCQAHDKESAKQLTAVEFAFEELNNWRIKNIGSLAIIGIPMEVFEKAKEIEKKQRISDYYQGACDESDSHGAQYICKSDAEKWYNETFKAE